MDKWVGKNVVVTGASSGIGAAILVTLAKAGVNVVGLARRKDRVKALANLNKAAKGKIQALACDVSDPKSINSAFEWIEKNIGEVHIWVNNAGIARINKLTSDELKDEEIIDTIDTNFTGLALCSRKAVKLMEKTGEPGYIINVNSIGGQMTANGALAEFGINVYAATKHAVTNVTEILRLKLATKPNNTIRVSSISPGAVVTEIFTVAGMSEEAIKQLGGLKVEDIGDAVIYLLITPTSVNVTELTIRPFISP